jgi:hypothetical protein
VEPDEGDTIVNSGGVVSFSTLSSHENTNNKLKIKLINDNFFILEYTMNYSVKLKTPFKWGSYWMELGILGLG